MQHRDILALILVIVIILGFVETVLWFMCRLALSVSVYTNLHFTTVTLRTVVVLHTDTLAVPVLTRLLIFSYRVCSFLVLSCWADNRNTLCSHNHIIGPSLRYFLSIKCFEVVYTWLCRDIISSHRVVGHLLLLAWLPGTHWVTICVIRRLAVTVWDVCLRLVRFQSTSRSSALTVLHNMHCINLRFTYLLYMLYFLSDV